MTDLELAKLAGNAILQASNHTTTMKYDGNEPGTPPDGWWEHAETLLTEHGYTLSREPISPESTGHPRKDGFLEGITSGPDHPEHPSMVKINTEISPARAFSVTAHEIAHVLLGHFAKTMEKLIRINLNLLVYGLPEIFEEEIAAELAAEIVLQVAGLPLQDTGLTYLAQRLERVSPYNGGAGAKIVADAVEAARVLIGSLVPEEVAA